MSFKGRVIPLAFTRCVCVRNRTSVGVRLSLSVVVSLIPLISLLRVCDSRRSRTSALCAVLAEQSLLYFYFCLHVWCLVCDLWFTTLSWASAPSIHLSALYLP